ncbi:MAG: exopolysaccharide biosynthesis protein [Alphaproteobacteria bacterium]
MLDGNAEGGAALPPSEGTKPNGVSLADLLTAIANDTSRERISVAYLLTALQDRALGALMFIFAIPNVLPTPPGTSAILGAPLVFLTAQLALGLRPWLPKIIAERSILRSDYAVWIARATPWLTRAQRLLRPRLTRAVRPPAEYLIGLLCFILSIILFLPIPLGNMLPALAICLFSLGILERDGVWVLIGLLATAISFALVWGVIYAVAKIAIFTITHAFR